MSQVGFEHTYGITKPWVSSQIDGRGLPLVTALWTRRLRWKAEGSTRWHTRRAWRKLAWGRRRLKARRNTKQLSGLPLRASAPDEIVRRQIRRRLWRDMMQRPGPPTRNS